MGSSKNDDNRLSTVVAENLLSKVGTWQTSKNVHKKLVGDACQKVIVQSWLTAIARKTVDES